MPIHRWALTIERTGPAWTWFDVERYAQTDAIAARAARASPEAALDDFEQRGNLCGIAPNVFFDPAFYLAANPSVQAAIDKGECYSAFDHYRTVGWRDRDPHWLFSWVRYGANNSDLSIAESDAVGGHYGHYLQSGLRQGRCANHFFDLGWYLSGLSEAETAAASENPFEHFLLRIDRVTLGEDEPLASPYFDPSWYLATYPDVAASQPARGSGALRHYLIIGAAEGRDPLCDFSEADYRALYPDVDSAITNGHFRSGYEHFLHFGASGLRSPTRDLDLAWYAAQTRVSRDLATSQYASAYFHLLVVGIPQGLPLQPPLRHDFFLAEAEARAAFVTQARRSLPGFGRRPLDFAYASAPDLACIVVLRNQFALTMQALASLRNNFGGAIQLIVVDNASNDDTRGIADLVHGARIIRLEENVGFLRACNIALAYATTAPAILYLNNDVVLHPGAIRNALDRLHTDRSIGAVGGKVIRTHGLLQEAGCILWRDGSAEGWMRDSPPDAPEANYVRDVDFCSACFLMVDGDLLRSLGGFDDAFAPAYYEEVDLCLRTQAAGYRVVYDPMVVLTHYEYGSSRSVRAAAALMRANQNTLRVRHPAALRARVADRRLRADGAARTTRGRRVLFIEDTVPLHRLGSGYGRAADALTALIAAGWQATVYPMHPVRTPLHHITATLRETTEILWDRDHRTLDSFLDARRGYYDLIWVSRAHNLRQLLAIVQRSGIGLDGAKLVLDTEAVFSLRESLHAELDGMHFNLPQALSREFEGAWLCDHVVAVNATEATVLRNIPLSSVGIVGFRQPTSPTITHWSERRGLLHVGSLTAEQSPNCDGLRWYLDAVYPLLEPLVGAEAAMLTVVGHISDEVDLGWLREHPGVRLIGSVTDLRPFYAAARAFLAPTRYAAGASTKILDAAAHGLPAVCTDLLARQLGWERNKQVLAVPATDPAGFAAATARLLTVEKTWSRTRAAALDALHADYSPARFEAQIAAAVAAAGASSPVSSHSSTAVRETPARGSTPPKLRAVSGN